MDDLNWKGDEVKAKMLRAQVIGINRTMGMCVIDAKQNHGFTNRTTHAEESIAIQTPAQKMGDQVAGIWGSRLIFYFKFLEMGTAAMFDRRGTHGKQRSSSKAPTWKGGYWRPTLRTTAAKIYPLLVGQMQKAWAGLA